MRRPIGAMIVVRHEALMVSESSAGATLPGHQMRPVERSGRRSHDGHLPTSAQMAAEKLLRPAEPAWVVRRATERKQSTGTCPIRRRFLQIRFMSWIMGRCSTKNSQLR